MSDAGWQGLQHGIDTCAACRSDPCFIPRLPPQSRPWDPGRPGRLLLISEAPPESGGFWHLPGPDAGDLDDLRAQVLQLLASHGLVLETGQHDAGALRVFMAAGFFLVQALKWPLAKREGKKGRSFNHLLRGDQVRLTNHGASVHLRDELLATAPRAILAMGNAALQTCCAVSERRDSIPAGGVEEVRKSNGHGASVVLQGQPIPLEATLLPVDENMRKPARRGFIKVDIGAFLSRHDWGPGDAWPADTLTVPPHL